MSEFLQYGFMIRAALVGVMLGAVASYYGVFIVQRRLSFMGAGLSHAAFGGVALGLLLQTEPLFVAIPFTIAVGLAITWIRSHTGLATDTAIGIFFAVSVALGIIFLSFRGSSSMDAFAYLFGSLLAISATDVWAAGLLFVLALTTLPRLWGRWAYASFDSEMARADGLPIQRDNYVFSILLAMTIVVSIKLIGILLIASVLVIPAASARLICSTFVSMTWTSALFGTLSVLVGLLLSFYLDLPSGAVVILVQATIFPAAIIAARIRRLS